MHKFSVFAHVVVLVPATTEADLTDEVVAASCLVDHRSQHVVGPEDVDVVRHRIPLSVGCTNQHEEALFPFPPNIKHRRPLGLINLRRCRIVLLGLEQAVRTWYFIPPPVPQHVVGPGVGRFVGVVLSTIRVKMHCGDAFRAQEARHASRVGWFAQSVEAHGAKPSVQVRGYEPVSMLTAVVGRDRLQES